MGASYSADGLDCTRVKINSSPDSVADLKRGLDSVIIHSIFGEKGLGELYKEMPKRGSKLDFEPELKKPESNQLDWDHPAWYQQEPNSSETVQDNKYNNNSTAKGGSYQDDPFPFVGDPRFINSRRSPMRQRTIFTPITDAILDFYDDYVKPKVVESWENIKENLSSPFFTEVKDSVKSTYNSVLLGYKLIKLKVLFFTCLNFITEKWASYTIDENLRDSFLIKWPRSLFRGGSSYDDPRVGFSRIWPLMDEKQRGSASSDIVSEFFNFSVYNPDDLILFKESKEEIIDFISGEDFKLLEPDEAKALLSSLRDMYNHDVKDFYHSLSEYVDRIIQLRNHTDGFSFKHYIASVRDFFTNL